MDDFPDGMPFLGGATWIDLVNSVLAPSGEVIDCLADDKSFRTWLGHAGLAISGSAGKERAALIHLRETLRPAFEDLAAEQPISSMVLSEINALLERARNVRQIRRDEKGDYQLSETSNIEAPRAVVAIAEDFARFLVKYEVERLKHCHNPQCTMVFYDRGKNNHRRWCSSAVCGNRDKVARYRARNAPRPTDRQKRRN